MKERIDRHSFNLGDIQQTNQPRANLFDNKSIVYSAYELHTTDSFMFSLSY